MLQLRALEQHDLFHEVATLFPPMTEEEFALFVADVQHRGLLDPIWTSQGKIIDGIHRYRACQQLGIEPRYQEWDGAGSLVSFVVSRNLHRRHLTSTQRTMVALEIEKQLAIEAKRHMALGGGDRKSGSEIFPTPIVTHMYAAEDAAAAVGTNPHYVRDAKKIVEKAPELKEKMKRGQLAIPEAKILASLPQEQRTEALKMKESGRAKTVKGAVVLLKQTEAEAQAQEAPTKPQITLASWEDWLPNQPLCDLLLTDPPYSTDVEDMESFAQAWLPLALSKVRSTGRAYVCIGAYPQELRAYLNVRTCWPVQQMLVWSYRNTLGPKPAMEYKQNWQAILYFYGPDAAPLDCPLLTEQFSAQEISAPDGRVGGRYHPWQKPDALAEQLIRHSTRPGDLIYDVFGGTGTFLLAANRLGRIGLGCEISEEMLALAEKRGCAIER